MPTPPVLVALDLDGTLLTEDALLSAGHARAVRELLHSGIQVALVTGRPLLTTASIWHELNLRTPAVCFNGGWVGTPAGERAPQLQTLAQAVLSEADVRTIVAAVADIDAALCAYPDLHTWIMDREIPLTRRWREFYRTDISIAPDRFAVWHGHSHKMMVVGEPAKIPQVAARLSHRLGARFPVVISQHDRIEILPPAVSKAWGLARLAAHLGVARTDVWAVGDADNDIEMIDWAGHGCVMGQAEAKVRAHARHVLPGVGARGLCALPGLIARHRNKR